MQIALMLLAGTMAAGTVSVGPDCHCPAGCSEGDEAASNVVEASHTTVVEEEYETPAQPGLEVGDSAPELTLLNEKGEEVELSELWGAGPIVLTFYRGHWCPYCTRALSAWQKKIPELTEAGGTFVGLTPEKPAYVDQVRGTHGLEYVVLSDAQGEAGRAFRVQFSMDEKTIKRYQGYGIDLTKFNSEGEWTLPAPATFVIDTEGVVRWVWADWDYSQRADPDDVIEAVRAING